jgi:hypothetical protein
MNTLHPGIMYTPPYEEVVGGGFPPLWGQGESGPPIGVHGTTFPNGGSRVNPLKEKFP